MVETLWLSAFSFQHIFKKSKNESWEYSFNVMKARLYA